MKCLLVQSSMADPHYLIYGLVTSTGTQLYFKLTTRAGRFKNSVVFFLSFPSLPLLICMMHIHASEIPNYIKVFELSSSV